MDYIRNILNRISSVSSGEGKSTGMNWVVGAIVAALIGLTVYFVLGRIHTRPVDCRNEGFMGAVTGTSNLPCGRNSSEAEELFALFNGKPITTENGGLDRRDLRDLLSKMACLKSDLMAPQQTITATKELGFATHMDIQPVADLTARCFTKTIPERDLSIQFEKWRDYGMTLIARLCTDINASEAEVQKAEALFKKVWDDVKDVSYTTCLSSVGEGAFKQSPHEAAPHETEETTDLRPYDGYY
jgi:hypothetical protein